MNRTQARQLAETLTNAQLKAMFEKAKTSISDWTRTATVNKGMTKGAAWNILAADFDETKNYPTIAKLNMIWEFGDYLPWDLRNPKKEKKEYQPKAPVHQEPRF